MSGSPDRDGPVSGAGRLVVDDWFDGAAIGYREAGAGGTIVVIIEVRRDDQVVAQQIYEPRYVADEPNGRGCGEVRTAKATLAIPTP